MVSFPDDSFFLIQFFFIIVVCLWVYFNNIHFDTFEKYKLMARKSQEAMKTYIGETSFGTTCLQYEHKQNTRIYTKKIRKEFCTSNLLIIFNNSLFIILWQNLYGAVFKLTEISVESVLLLNVSPDKHALACEYSRFSSLRAIRDV